MSEYRKDIEKYTSDVDDTAVDNIAKYLGIALRNRDSSLVSCSDRGELDRVRDGFCTKKLGLGKEEADAAIDKVCDQMSGDRAKHRVTFYYLLAQNTGNLSKLH